MRGSRGVGQGSPTTPAKSQKIKGFFAKLVRITLKTTSHQASIHYRVIICTPAKRDSSIGRASAFGAGGRGFESRPHHTKSEKNGTSSSLADARINGVVLGRMSKTGKYLLKVIVMSQ